MEANAKILRLFRTQPLALTIALGLVVGVVVCVEAGANWFAPPHAISEPRYLVARRDLAAGEPIDFLDFTLAYARELRSLPRGALTDQDLDLLRNAMLESPLSEGAVLTAAGVSGPGGRVLSPASIPMGKLAYSFRAYGSITAREGDHIDILFETGADTETSETLVENALVLEALPPADPEDSARGRDLVVALDSDEIGLLEKARHRGKLNIVLRNPEDIAQRHPKKRSLWSIRKKREVEILSEGL